MTSSSRVAAVGAFAGLAAVVAAAVALTGAPARGAAQARPPAPQRSVHAHAAGGVEVAPAPTRAQRLIAATRRNLERWPTVEAAEAAGFASIGDAITGYEHYVKWRWVDDDRILSPRRPESLVFRVAGGESTLVSALYILPPGSRMSDAPDLGDARARWHRHTDLCWEDGRVAGVVVEGRCVPRGTLEVTPPMLHVWLEDHECGPFAGIESHGHRCDAGAEHGHD